MESNTLVGPMPPWIVEPLLAHPDALRFIDIVYRSIEVWDDIIDRDNGVSDDDIHAAFTSLLLELPFNRFFEQHKAALVPMISVVITAWHASNALAKDGAEGAQAYTLRKEFINLCVLVVTLTRGLDEARRVAIAGWRTSAAEDSLDEFTKGK